MVFSNISIDSHQTYPVSENLIIELDNDNAVISGEFIFRTAPHAQHHNLDHSGHVRVPIWLPIPEHRLHDTNALKNLVLNSTKKLTDILAFQIEINGTTPEIFWFDAFDEDPFDQDESSKHIRNDVLEVLCMIPLRSATLTNDVRVTVSYKQPLIKKDQETILFYIPFLHNVEKAYLEAHANEYHISVQCPSEYELIPMSKLEYHTPSTSTNLHIIPQHEQPIEVVLKRKS